MTADADPVVPRQALRRRIEQAIEERGGRRQVAASLGWNLSDFLLVAAATEDVAVDRLDELTSAVGFSPSREVRALVEYEAAATAIRTFEPYVVPGLLQTRAYAESVLRFYAPAESLAAVVDARLARQSLLERDDRPDMTFVMDQSALHRGVTAGDEGQALLREQLHYLRQLAQRVEILVIPYSAGVHEGVKGPFVILESDAPILYLEDAKGDTISVDPEFIRLHRERFANLKALAVPAEAFIARTLEDLA
jgi:hypothetical protein